MAHISIPEDMPGIRGLMAYSPDTALHINQLVEVLLQDAHTLTPGEREIIVDGETGWVVPPNNPGAIGAAIASLRNDPTRALAMGTAGRRRIEQEFTWAAVVRRCLDAYGD